MATAKHGLLGAPHKEGSEPQSKVMVEGLIAVEIAGKTYVLAGKIGGGLSVKYEKPYDEAFDLGTMPVIIESVAGVFGVDQVALQKKFDDTVTELQNAGSPFDKLGDFIQSAKIRITYLEINTSAHTYGLGVAFDVRKAGWNIGGVKLDAFGLKVVYSKPPDAKTPEDGHK